MRPEFTPDLKGFSKDMRLLAEKQLPFAIALTITSVAGGAGLAWQDEMKTHLDRPTPFTINSVAISAARKSDPTATVYIKDVAAQYLEPFVDGGPHFLGAKRGLLVPKAISLNAYGNISKGKLAALKASGKVFIGPVRFKSGAVISGVWQRSDRGTRTRGRGIAKKETGYGSLGANQLKSNLAKGLADKTTLKLLVRFSDPQQVKQHLAFPERAEAAVLKYLQPDFDKAFAKAMATAK